MRTFAPKLRMNDDCIRMLAMFYNDFNRRDLRTDVTHALALTF